MLVDFFLERSRIELLENGLSYRGSIPDLPGLEVNAPTPEQCRARLAAALTALLVIEARKNRAVNGRDANDNAATPPTTEALLAGGQHLNPDDSTQVTDPDVRTSEYTDIIYERRDWIAQLTINRPAAYNAYTDNTLREMADAFHLAASDKSIA